MGANAMTAASTLQWTPYGYMCEDFEWDAANPTPPPTWTGTPFFTWIEGIADDLSNFAWPRWDQGHWRQGPAASNADALTTADLDIMSRIWSGFDEDPRKTGKPHSWWFAWEDDLDGSPWDERLGISFLRCGIGAKRFQEVFAGGVGDCVTVALMLKARLQRPRAYQMSLVLGAPRIPLKPSISAWSPSSISGHAFNGLMGCLALHRHLTALGPYRSELVDLAIDIGDRRVLAGIHYPSDNAMSWWVALKCVEHLTPNKDEKVSMREFISDAVRASQLWPLMQASRAHHPLVEALTPLLTGK
jgi:hypothetical protein